MEEIWSEWKIDELIGEGISSKVYKAKREDINQTFYSAIKVITIPKIIDKVYFEDNCNSEDLKEIYQSCINYILKKITLLEKLKGAKNIINIDDCKVDQNKWEVYLRMDLLTNSKKYFSNNPMAEIDIINLGIDICDALQTCEKMEIAHGNIKPENIFVSKFKEYKLGDFLLAQKIGEQSDFINKRDYVFSAPEIYRNYQPNNTTDMYSLGIVMYYLLNHNRIPFMPKFPNKTTFKDINTAIIRRANGEEIPKLENISDELYKIIKRMCAFKKEERYISAEELKYDLISIQKKEEEVLDVSYEKTVSLFSKRRQQANEEQRDENREEKTKSDMQNAKQEEIINAEQRHKVQKEEIQKNQRKINKKMKKHNKYYNKKEKNKEFKKENQSKKNYKLLLILIPTILIVSTAGIILFAKRHEPELKQEELLPEKKLQVIVPNVVDMKFEVAEKVLQQIGFKVEKEEIENSGEESQTVLKQSIESNTMVEEGTTIILQIAK